MVSILSTKKVKFPIKGDSERAFRQGLAKPQELALSDYSRYRIDVGYPKALKLKRRALLTPVTSHWGPTLLRGPLRHIPFFVAPPLRVRPSGRSCRSMTSRQCWRGSISSTPLWPGTLLSRSNPKFITGTRVLPSYACNYHVQSRLELVLASVRKTR